MPPKIKIVDVVDKDSENDDNYADTVDEVKESELSNKNDLSIVCSCSLVMLNL